MKSLFISLLFAAALLAETDTVVVSSNYRDMQVVKVTKIKLGDVVNNIQQNFSDEEIIDMWKGQPAQRVNPVGFILKNGWRPQFGWLNSFKSYGLKNNQIVLLKETKQTGENPVGNWFIIIFWFSLPLICIVGSGIILRSAKTKRWPHYSALKKFRQLSMVIIMTAILSLTSKYFDLTIPAVVVIIAALIIMIGIIFKDAPASDGHILWFPILAIVLPSGLPLIFALPGAPTIWLYLFWLAGFCLFVYLELILGEAMDRKKAKKLKSRPAAT